MVAASGRSRVGVRVFRYFGPTIRQTRPQPRIVINTILSKRCRIGPNYMREVVNTATGGGGIAEMVAVTDLILPGFAVSFVDVVFVGEL